MQTLVCRSSAQWAHKLDRAARTCRPRPRPFRQAPPTSWLTLPRLRGDPPHPTWSRFFRANPGGPGRTGWKAGPAQPARGPGAAGRHRVCSTGMNQAAAPGADVGFVGLARRRADAGRLDVCRAAAPPTWPGRRCLRARPPMLATGGTPWETVIGMLVSPRRGPRWTAICLLGPRRRASPGSAAAFPDDNRPSRCGVVTAAMEPGPERARGTSWPGAWGDAGDRPIRREF